MFHVEESWIGGQMDSNVSTNVDQVCFILIVRKLAAGNLKSMQQNQSAKCPCVWLDMNNTQKQKIH